MQFVCLLIYLFIYYEALDFQPSLLKKLFHTLNSWFSQYLLPFTYHPLQIFLMALLRSVLDHAVLPPNVPGKRETEESYEEISDNLLARLLRACEQAESLAGQPYSDAIRSLSKSLQACRELNRGRLDKETMLRYFAQIKPHDVLILHVIEQNAAILIRHEIDE